MKQPSIATYRQQIERTKFVFTLNNYKPRPVTIKQFLAAMEALTYLTAKNDCYHFEHFKVT